MISEKELEKDVADFQNMQQQLQMIMMQKQQVMLSEAENQRASEAVGKAQGGQVYRVSGSVMVPKSKEELVKELGEEAESIKLRKEVLSKQEEKLKNALEKLRSKFESLEKDTRRQDGSDGGKISG